MRLRLTEQIMSMCSRETTALLSNLEGTTRTALPLNNEEEVEWGKGKKKSVVAHEIFFLQDAVTFKNMWAQHVQPFENTAQLRIAHSSRLDKECTSATLFRLLIPKMRREQRGGEKKNQNPSATTK